MRSRFVLWGAAAILVLLAPHFSVARPEDASDTMVLNVPSNRWFEGPGVIVSVASDGRWALLTNGPTMSLYSLETKEQDPERLLGGLTSVSRAGFCGPSGLIRLGARSSEKGVFSPGAETPQLLSIPAGSVVGCSSDASEIVYYQPDNPSRQLFVGPVKGPFKTFDVT